LERVLDEEWDDARGEILPPAYAAGKSLTVIASHDAAPEKGAECMKQIRIAFVLHDGELR
jgi:hypothetical protein